MLQEVGTGKVEGEEDFYYRATTKLLGDEGSTEWSYRPMNRVFYSKMWWVWIIQALAYVVVVTLYLSRDGKEIAFAIYIPVDCVLFLGMASYYFLQWYLSDSFAKT